MQSQIDAITRYVEMGYRAFTGHIDAAVYKRVDCPEPVFAKWLYCRLLGAQKAVCAGCNRECALEGNDALEYFTIDRDTLKTLDYNIEYAITPQEMVKRHSLLTARQAAYCLNVSERTIYNHVAEGKLVKLKDNPVRVRAADVERLMNDFDE